MFIKAKPIWIKGKEKEPNCRVQFKAICPKADNTHIHIATSGVYQLWINGEFVSYGPARAGKNHFRLENIDISRFLSKNENIVIIEVAGYYCTNFYIMQQDSFLQAEIVSNNNVLVSTDKDFTARMNPYYIQKIQRYSYQRTFAESYRIKETNDSFYKDSSLGDLEICETENKTIIPRLAPYPVFESNIPKLTFSGSVKQVIPEEYVYDRYVMQVGMKEGEPTGWKANTLDFFPEKKYQELVFTPDNKGEYGFISKDRYNTYEFSHNATGMVSFDITCESDVTICLSFDELMVDGKLNPRRCRVCNIIFYELTKGKHHIRTFEVYTMKYLQFAVLNGEGKIENLKLTEYKHPPIEMQKYDDERLQRVVDAAVETYRQNAVDLFTDCPSRERAGWLCDSFFLARAEYALTGKNTIEESFLENFLHEDIYGKVPKGMFPMCYPADHRFGRYIPNWAMWLVVELRDYLDRTGERELIERFKDKVYGLIKFFEDFENSDGLLEDLKSWVFVEWSRANDTDMIQGINYPSNMLYYLMLKSASELYGDKALLNKAENIKSVILKQSFDGEFFVDRAVRTNDGIFAVPESTEVCQYYAFFCGIATLESHKELFEKLVKEFGPKRDVQNCYPEIHPAAPFIGNYLRLQILMDNGYEAEILDNIKGYFYYMAERTGTLWEMAKEDHSCNHGFASCVLYWLKSINN